MKWFEIFPNSILDKILNHLVKFMAKMIYGDNHIHFIVSSTCYRADLVNITFHLGCFSILSFPNQLDESNVLVWFSV